MKLIMQEKETIHYSIKMPQVINIAAAKAAVDKEWQILEKNFGVEPDESQKEKKR